MINSETELPEAKTCALDKCLACKNRQRSAAVNDEHCVGGYRDKDGRMQKVIGSRLCNGCLCKTCCQELVDDANVIKKHGLGTVVKANVQLRNYARQLIQLGTASEEAEKLYFETRNKNPVLIDIRPEICERWAVEAIHIVVLLNNT
jgi:hypothetical protein